MDTEEYNASMESDDELYAWNFYASRLRRGYRASPPARKKHKIKWIVKWNFE